MAVESQHIDATSLLSSHDATAPIRAQRLVDLDATSASNIHAQFSSGSALNATSGFSAVAANTATRVPRIITGASHTETTYTLTGTDIYTGATITDEITVSAGAQDDPFNKPFATVTSLVSDADPGDTVDLRWGDTWVHPPARSCHVGTSGDLACRLADDSADCVVPDVPAGEFPRQIRIIRLTSTTASGLALGW